MKHPNLILILIIYWLLSICYCSCCYFLFFIKKIKLSTFVGSAWSFGFYIPATKANDFRLGGIFSIPDFIHYIYFPILILEKEPVFSLLNKGTTGTIFITSLVWCAPWLGIEPGTSRTRSQHSSTRLSRRRWLLLSCDILDKSILENMQSASLFLDKKFPEKRPTHETCVTLRTPETHSRKVNIDGALGPTISINMAMSLMMSANNLKI